MEFFVNTVTGNVVQPTEPLAEKLMQESDRYVKAAEAEPAPEKKTGTK